MSPADDSRPPIEPHWYKDAVIYQLHVKSFFDANDDGVGDFVGLLHKLDHIVSLGVTAVWLLPFYPSPRRDDGYDIAEYRDVHPDYGDLETVKRFIAAAHERGLRVITELVINHTSDQHPWFQRARRAPPGSPERNFYVWSDSDATYAGTRIIFVDTEKSNWTFDPVVGAYYWHRFYAHQPDLNFDNPQVLEEVLDVMRFWLALGVDGLRLDAVPYLVEREGTNNENLPETHAVLKRIRAEIDASFPDRMLLAEANQWPEDAQLYFGDGDECHMAFHFPLMPRMYMAIAQEDRFPITDILRQTPEIAPSCQWAIFLRNHDELTLEMVTDSERDYLWRVYASDRRARLNLGIRRRLAPLLERDRRRVELMHSLLLSMPGTPVIYYGDEIGMGDNIHLGDRDGVRTPMQWSPDRNGGFSRADPERLVLPPIMDPLYGYEAVNVEAQQRDPHSLLASMKRMLAVRRQQRCFGRGTLRLLYPRNRKVFAYLREHEGETLLCVVNLARSPQAVELDLAEFEARVPIELHGGSRFPPIGQLTYLLTLAPYGFYWFLLAKEAALPSWHTPAPEPMPDLTTLVLRDGFNDLLGPRLRPQLEREVLPAYLPMRRWFAAKAERLRAVRVSAAVELGPEIALAELETENDGAVDRWAMPLGISWEGESNAALPQQLALARVRRGSRLGLLTDGFALPKFARRLIELLRARAALPTADGEIRFLAEGTLDAVDIPPDAEISWLAAEQSNSSLIVGAGAIVKLLRRVAPGIHPEAEMSRQLAAAGFANAPALLGEVVRVGADGTPHTLAIVEAFVRNQGNAWTWTQDFLTRAVDELAGRDAEAQEDEDAFSPYTAFARLLGRRLAEMHVALALPSDDPAFAPESVGAATARRWAQAAVGQIERALAIVAARAVWPDETTTHAAQSLLALRAELEAAVPRLADSAIGTPCTRIHGDFHLGQVLVSSGDAVIVDFEGEPLKPLAERRAKSSPARDVAGLLRSLDYAVAVHRRGGLAPATPEGAASRERALAGFRREAEAAFRAGYAEVAPPGATWEELLDLFLIEKAAYEILYEAASRPDMIDIPVRGLAELGARIARVPVSA